MKRIVLLAVLSLSLFSVACGGDDASTCAEATDAVVEACKDKAGFTVSEDSTSTCEASDKKEEIIECANASDCDAILACSLKVALGG